MSKLLNQTKPKAHDCAVVFACDARQLPLAMFAADRIEATEPGGAFDIVICMPDIAPVPTSLRDGRVRFCQIDTSGLPEAPMFREWISYATYFRWLLPAAFSGEYETLFYLDTDTYLRRPGIGALFASLDRPVPLAAVSDFQRFVTFDAKREAFVSRKLRDMGGKDGQYYNAGVLLIQPEPFAAMEGFDRLLDGIARNVAFDPIYEEQDQGAMNLAFADVIEPLSPLYNWCSRDWLRDRLVARYDPAILHFAGPNKPWSEQDDPFIAGFAAEYAAYLTTNFPEFERKIAVNSAAWRMAKPKYSLPLLNELRTALYRRRYVRKLERSASEAPEKLAKMDASLAAARVGPGPKS